MREEEILMNPNPLVAYLKKPASEFTRHDLVQFAEENGIEMVNFRYVAEDGKLKTLNFIINSRAYLDTILAAGERVDGSSLFSFIEPGASDLYIVPRYRTAFVNPFSDIPSLEIMASFTPVKELRWPVRLTMFYGKPRGISLKKQDTVSRRWESLSTM